MSALERTRGRRGEERGSTIVIFALWLPVLVLFIVFVIDVGDWFVHKRHLQLQADAGAFAGGTLFNECFHAPVGANGDADIERQARTYAGDPGLNPNQLNRQIAPTALNNVLVRLNSGDYAPAADFTNGHPCDLVNAPANPDAGAVDVWLTDQDLPLFFRTSGLFPSVNVRARARVELKTGTVLGGLLPIGVNDRQPRLARAYFIDENHNGQVLGSVPLDKQPGSLNGLQIWNSSTPFTIDNSVWSQLVAGNPNNQYKIGVRIALGGRSSTTCKAAPSTVQCFDLGTNGDFDANDPGLLLLRGFNQVTGGSTSANPPRAWDVYLYTTSIPSACPGAEGGYFFYLGSGNCNFGVKARINFGAGNFSGPAGTQLAVPGFGCPNGGTPAGCPMTFNSGDGYWYTTGPQYPSIAAGTGPASVSINWRTGAGNSNRGTIQDVHRIFSGQSDAQAPDARSGPIRQAFVSEGASFPRNTFQLNTTHTLTVTIGIKTLELAQPGDPPYDLRFGQGQNGSQTHAINCDENRSTSQQFQLGCAPLQTENTDPNDTCPNWSGNPSGPQPRDCVLTQGNTGSNPVKGLADRINPGGGCVHPNNWPNYAADDPRIVTLFITPIGSFSSSGGEVFPINRFASFYIADWGGPFEDKCSPPVAQGDIVGYFVKYVTLSNTGGGTLPCDPAAIEPCVAVLVK